ncbi:MAG TPA: hypothetical protein EYP85_06780 [Armatimonadetes bacterium]|nr:hypothetical protein [Armatimonadota bacterium]
MGVQFQQGIRLLSAAARRPPRRCRKCPVPRPRGSQLLPPRPALLPPPCRAGRLSPLPAWAGGEW